MPRAANRSLVVGGAMAVHRGSAGPRAVALLVRLRRGGESVEQRVISAAELKAICRDSSAASCSANYREVSEPFRKVVESVESDVIHCGAPESRRVLDVEARTSPCR